jgi:hypothetical protein
MSLAIDVDEITHVLLADGWHEIEQGSFFLDSYEYVAGVNYELLHGGGHSGICATGFRFRVRQSSFTTEGPLTSIIAIRRP